MLYSIIHYYDYDNNILSTSKVVTDSNNIVNLFDKTNTQIQYFINKYGYYYAQVKPISSDGQFSFLVYNCFTPLINKINFININSEVYNNNLDCLEKYKILFKKIIMKVGLNDTSYYKIVSLVRDILSNECLFVDIIGFNIDFKNSLENHIDINFYINAISSNIYDIRYLVSSGLSFLDFSVSRLLEQSKVTNQTNINNIVSLILNRFKFISNIEVIHKFDYTTSLNNVEFVILSSKKVKLFTSIQPYFYFLKVNNQQHDCMSMGNSSNICLQHVNNFGKFKFRFNSISNVNEVFVNSFYTSNKSLNSISIYNFMPLYYIDMGLFNKLEINLFNNVVSNKYTLIIDKVFFSRYNIFFDVSIGYCLHVFDNIMFNSNLNNYINSIFTNFVSFFNTKKHHRSNMIFDFNINTIYLSSWCRKLKLGCLYGFNKLNIISSDSIIPASFYLEYRSELIDLYLSFNKFIKNNYDIVKDDTMSSFLFNIYGRIYKAHFSIQHYYSNLKNKCNDKLLEFTGDTCILIFFGVDNIISYFLNYINNIYEIEVGFSFQYKVNLILPYVAIKLYNFM